jgi:hypothetical protein
MKETFPIALKYLLADEMGKEAERDPSRNTPRHFAVTPAILHLYSEGSPQQLEVLTEEEASNILRAVVWDVVDADYLPLGVDYFAFDLGYRFTTPVARQWLMYAGAYSPDRPAATVMIEELDRLQRRRLRSDPQWASCKYWWTNRSNRPRDRAYKLCRGTTP